MATREKTIFSSMKKDVDAIILMNAVEPNLDSSFFYATGIPSGLFEGCLAIIEPRRTEVLVSELEALSAKEARVKVSVFENGEKRGKLMKKKLSRYRRIGVNSTELTHSNYELLKRMKIPGSKLVDISKDLHSARMIKQPDELSRIRKACSIASRACQAIPKFVREGVTETQAAADLACEMMGLGASGPGFESVVAFGSKSAEPHYSPSVKRRLKPGNFALFDFGAKYQRYVSDLTRTFVCGTASRKKKEMHSTVLEAQRAALDEIADGVMGSVVDEAARRVIDGTKFEGLFIHSTGHGIGISVHDPGSISSVVDMELKEGMVLTVEPGVYIPKYGGVRIEDDILVTKKGCRVLTSCSKELRAL
ncbi:MAG: aminopeptidase P family protein [Methanobacteriota archaeon]|nr:MAG: aminopeptidase P family protein [Euryarchaeota archaeon]